MLCVVALDYVLKYDCICLCVGMRAHVSVLVRACGWLKVLKSVLEGKQMRIHVSVWLDFCYLLALTQVQGLCLF